MNETSEQIEKRQARNKQYAAIDRKHRAFLKRCLLDGQYITEHATDFWSKRDDADCLAGERKCLGSDLTCASVHFTGKALLVSYTDSTGVWFSWIH